MNVVFVYADSKEEWNCSNWRSDLPSQYLKKYCGWETSLVAVSDISVPKNARILEKANIIFVERLLTEAIFQKLNPYLMGGAKMIFDMDDSYENMPPSSLSYQFWISGLRPDPNSKKLIRVDYPPIEQIKWFSKLADAISSPSKLILDDWKDYNDRMLWLPNYLDVERYDRIPFRENKITIGWGGGASHYPSFYDSGLMAALKRILYNNKDKVELCLITGDQTLTHKLKELHPNVLKSDSQKFPKDVQKIDIALAPLSGAYDRRRSWLKIAEYAVCGIPFIASNYDPYRDYNYPGSLLIEKEKPAIWEYAIQTMIDDHQFYYDKAQESCDQWRKDFTIQENWQFLQSQFESVM